MRKEILSIAILVLSLLLFTSCEERVHKDIKPINWGNYNDVCTVFWNFYTPCKEVKSECDGKTIKISGWQTGSYNYCSLHLCDDTISRGFTTYISIFCSLPEFKAKLDTSDLTKKCFVKGKLSFDYMNPGKDCMVRPMIEITNIDDIYFK